MKADMVMLRMVLSLGWEEHKRKNNLSLTEEEEGKRERKRHKQHAERRRKVGQLPLGCCRHRRYANTELGDAASGAHVGLLPGQSSRSPAARRWEGRSGWGADYWVLNRLQTVEI